MGNPVRTNTIAATTIAQKYTFCPPLKYPTSSASTVLVFVTYSRMRFIHRRSAGVQVIGSSQFRNWSAKNSTKPRLNHGCSRRVDGPPPKSGVSQWYSQGE